MRSIIRRSAVVMMMAVFVGLVTFLAANQAQGQCTVVNNTPCSVFLTVYDGAGIQYTQLIPFGPPPVPYNMPPGFMPVGVVDANGVAHPFIPPPPAFGCTPCIPLRTPPPGFPCCAIVCYDPATCTFHIHPCPAPC